MRIKINKYSPLYNTIIEELKNEPPVLLAGSFISTWAPTLLPNGQQIAGDLFEVLFPQAITQIDDAKNRYLKNIFHRVPFEHIFERCPNEQAILEIIVQTFALENWNQVHEVICRALANNQLSHLITTNYDLCFDKVIQHFSYSNISRIVSEKDTILTSDLSQKIYFKIHGSAEPSLNDSIVFSLRHESLMPEWKRHLVTDLLSQKNLLVIGYSGLDFEICPELLRIPVKRIIWNNFRDEFPSPNAERIITQNPQNVLLVGDMRELISDLMEPVSPCYGQAVDNFVQEIQKKLNGDELTLWRLALLNSMGCPGIALRLVKFIEKQNQALAHQMAIQRQKAQALFHAGQYKNSARCFGQSALFSLSSAIKAESWLDACDAWRCYGAFYSSGKCLRKSIAAIRLIRDKTRKKRTLGKVHLKRVLLFRQLYQLSRPFKHLRRFIQKRCEYDLRIASKIALETGNWFEFQQIRWWAERLEIDSINLADHSHYEAPPAKSGYDQLGYHIAQSGVFRDQLRRNVYPLEDAERDALNRHLKNCQQFENYPELWKLLFLKLKHDRQNWLATFGKFVYYFVKCQYRPLMRVFQIGSGG